MGKLTDAVLKNDIECVKTLLNTNALPFGFGGYKDSQKINDEVSTIDRYNGHNALFIACCEGFVEIAQLLIKAGALLNNTDDSYFMAAATNNQVEILKLLIKYGEDPDSIRELDGSSALIMAAHFGNLETVEYLLECKANINYQRKDGFTALHAAVESNHIEIARVLIFNRADYYIKDNFDETPYSMAINKNSPQMKKLLEKARREAKEKYLETTKRIQKIQQISINILLAAKEGQSPDSQRKSELRVKERNRKIELLKKREEWYKKMVEKGDELYGPFVTYDNGSGHEMIITADMTPSAPVETNLLDFLSDENDIKSYNIQNISPSQTLTPMFNNFVKNNFPSRFEKGEESHAIGGNYYELNSYISNDTLDNGRKRNSY